MDFFFKQKQTKKEIYFLLIYINGELSLGMEHDKLITACDFLVWMMMFLQTLFLDFTTTLIGLKIDQSTEITRGLQKNLCLVFSPK